MKTVKQIRIEALKTRISLAMKRENFGLADCLINQLKKLETK